MRARAMLGATTSYLVHLGQITDRPGTPSCTPDITTALPLRLSTRPTSLVYPYSLSLPRLRTVREARAVPPLPHQLSPR